jgi:hypothetical protein
MVETDITKRWEQGTPHHPESVKLFESIAEIDLAHCDDSFCWKSGGDGDNGERLMYLLDIHFERLDAQAVGASESTAAIRELDDLLRDAKIPTRLVVPPVEGAQEKREVPSFRPDHYQEGHHCPRCGKHFCRCG